MYFSKISQTSKVDGTVERTAFNTVLDSTEHSDTILGIKGHRPDGTISVAIVSWTTLYINFV